MMFVSKQREKELGISMFALVGVPLHSSLPGVDARQVLCRMYRAYLNKENLVRFEQKLCKFAIFMVLTKAT
jgi:hypothetical protein